MFFHMYHVIFFVICVLVLTLMTQEVTTVKWDKDFIKKTPIAKIKPFAL